MKKIILFITLIVLYSCTPSKDTENKYINQRNEIEKINTLKKNEIEALFKKIKLNKTEKQNFKDSENVYFAVKKFNSNLDSLIKKIQLKKQDREVDSSIVQKYYFYKKEFISKLNITNDLKSKQSIDSLLHNKYELYDLPNFAIQSEFVNSKLNANNVAILLLNK
ncbi:hypothetical protein [Aureivirga sp. CE67]|uniref:hypothetical protein n=1 Tax=Aureivirga sp. CE67 TaxID=1788983 RepID=UPI0018C9A319|nr:hypothetical protein [Aureivirga sp. CE67]